MKTQKQKRLEAETRAAARQRRSDIEQLAVLAGRPGQSAREIKRLIERINPQERQ